MIKGARDKYYTNDSRIYWKKIKRGFMSSKKDPNISQVQLDLVVMGANRGTGTNNRQVYASFLLGTQYNGNIIPISFVGSGFTNE
jgi:ATP-dependent DNA ligase